VISCIELIAKSGLKQDAEDICVRYAEAGSQLLKGTYEKLRERDASKS